MNMTAKAVVIGSLLILGAVVFVVVALPYATRNMTPSEIHRARTTVENLGRRLYIENGCVYCHSQSIRSIDWGHGADRIAQSGDYLADEPIALGSQRTGVDLSQEGGEHPHHGRLAGAARGCILGIFIHHLPALPVDPLDVGAADLHHGRAGQIVEQK